MRPILIAASVCSPVVSPAAAQSSVRPASLQWSNPTTLPLGALAAVASGTVLALTFSGPYTITYLRAEDAPRPRNFPSATES